MKKFKRKHYKKEFSFPSYPQPFPAPHHRQYSYYFLLYASRDVLWVYRHTYMVYSFLFFFLISEVAYYTTPCCFHFLYLGSLLSHPGLVHSCCWLCSIPWCGEGIWDRKAPTRVCWIDGGFLCCPRHLRHVALSVQFSRSLVSSSFRPHGLQQAKLPCPSLSSGACSDSCPLSWWCHPTISSSVIPFSSCPQSFPASGSFLTSQLFASGGQSIGTSASSSVLPVSIQDWFPLGLTGLISGTRCLGRWEVCSGLAQQGLSKAESVFCEMLSTVPSFRPGSRLWNP